MKLSSNVALITGAGSGIGRATSTLFANNGAKIVAVDWVVEMGEETVKIIKEAGGEGLFIRADVSKALDAERAIKATIDKYQKLDILVNNAGIGQESVPLTELSEEEWDKVISVNLKGAFLMSKYAIREMLKQGKGVVVNLASIASIVGMMNGTAYAASKGGVASLTKTVALEYGRSNIRVNCVVPSYVRTGITHPITGGTIEGEKRWVKFQPIPRMGNPEEIAAAILFLASDDSSFVTGTCLTVDGGYTAI